MDYNYRDILKLKSFFTALKNGGFKSNLNQIPTSIRAESLALLRKLPQFKGEEFKDDSVLINALNIYLKDPSKRKFFLDQAEFSRQEQEEFNRALEEEPVDKEVFAEQPVQEQPAVGEQPSTMTGGSSIPQFSGSAPRIHIARQTKPPVETVTPPQTTSTAAKTAVETKTPSQPIQTSSSAAQTRVQTNSPSTFTFANSEKPTVPTATTPTKTPSNPIHQPVHETPSRPTSISKPRFQAPKVPYEVSNAAKNLGSQLSISTKLGGGRVANGLGNMLKGLGGAGRDALGGGIGATGRAAGRLGTHAINAGARFSQAVGGDLSLSGAEGVGMGKKIAMALTLFGLFLGFSLIVGTTGGNPTNPTTPTIPVTIGSGSISNCKFTRAGTQYAIKSTILQGWIVQAAINAGISPVVLASTVMHESATFVANADDNHDDIKTNNYCVKANIFCEKSGQVLHSISGKDDPCTPAEIATGARNAQAVGLGQNIDIYNPGKNLCSITESLAISANKLKADGITTQPTETQIAAGIRKYFNACDYGAYSYCNEVWKDTQACQQATPSIPPSQPGSGVHPVAPPVDPAGLKQAIIDKFSITMNGFDSTHLQWAWEKLWNVSNTKFVEFIKGSTLEAIASGDSEQVGPPNARVTIKLGQYSTESIFKYIFTHEFGHVIRNYGASLGNFFPEHYNAFTREGGVTYYANNTEIPGSTCPRSNAASEDYAEMIALYLNPNAGAQATRCTPAGTPYTNLQLQFPLHYNIARSVLGAY